MQHQEVLSSLKKILLCIIELLQCRKTMQLKS